MMTTMTQRSRALGLLVRLPTLMERAGGRATAAVGRELGAARRGDLPLLLAWAEREGGGATPLHVPGVSLAVLLLAALGLVLGGSAAAALFRYTGEHPVNVLAVLAVFVGVQVLLVLLTVLLALPASWRRWVPGLAWAQDAVGAVSPGRLIALGVRLLPQAQREQVDRVVGRAAVHGRLYGRVEKWLVIRSAQVLGVAFNLGAIGAAVALVVGSDLAFGWSTTLQLPAERFTAVARALAWPWAWAWPDAAPTGELVEATRYFRGQAFDPQVHGGWWPFLVAAMVTYGLLPRVVLLAVATWRLRAAAARAVLQWPGVEGVLRSLRGADVRTEATDAERGVAALASTPGGDDAGPAISDDGATVVRWCGVGVGGGVAAGEALEAGAGAYEVDEAALAEIGRRKRGVVIYAKAWEPPLLELVDFVRAARRAIGEGPMIVVRPVGRGGGGAAGDDAVDEMTMRVWRQRFAGVGDPWLRVVAAEVHGGGDPSLVEGNKARRGDGGGGA